MQCHDVRQLADAYLAGELLVETQHEIVRHLEGCPACRADLESRQALRSQLRRAFLAAPDLAPAPAQLADWRERLALEAGARRRFRPWWRRPGWVAAAAALVMATTAGVLWGRDAASLAALARTAWGDHRNCAVAFHLAEPPIPLREAARFDPVFARFEGVPADWTASPAGDITVVERHSCVFAGRRFAHVVMSYHGQLVSLFVTDDSTAGVGAMVRSLSMPTAAVRIVSTERDTSAMFRVGSRVAIVLGTLTEADLRQVAGVLVDPVAAALSVG